MGSTFYIKNNETGEIRPYHDDFEFFEYIWAEGNFSCDCNRHMFFTDTTEDYDCGECAYSIVDVHDDDGKRTDEMIQFIEKEKLK